MEHGLTWAQSFASMRLNLGGRRGASSERPLGSLGGMPPEKKMIAKYPDIDL